jgi:hypothetical protein
MAAEHFFIEGTNVFIQCQNKLAVLDFSNPAAPSLLHQYGLGLNFVDIDKFDSLVVTIGGSSSMDIYDYDPVSGFTLLYDFNCYADCPMVMVLDGINLYVIRDESLNEVSKYSLADPLHPQRVDFGRAIYFRFYSLEIFSGSLWASGPFGTVIFDTTTMDSIGYYGPEYFSDVRDMFISGDTFYAADGENGLKVFTFENDPASGLDYAGDYQTGNEVNQIATIGDNFFISDYYSLHHLRWGAPTGTEPDDQNRMPGEIALLQNYPNPFNALTTIEFTLARASEVKLEIFDILGRKVAMLAEGRLGAGKHRVRWDAGEVPSGVYFYRLSAGDRGAARMCILLK